MHGKIGKFSGISTAVIILVLIALLVTLLIAKRVRQTATAAKPTPVAEQTQAQKGNLLTPKKQLPQIREISEDQGLDEQFFTDQGKRALEHSSLQDLPLEEIPEDELVEQRPEVEQQDQLELSPDPEEIKRLQQKGLIIY